ncbi:hypothetical protein ASE73_08375 [Sphingomonas sp. Leaf24]|nr:hypothetical protein ASE50_06415 [Sphingomonas sp. Leaf5]KQM89046.1 hypothetical protein ASE73_08375 [Sphingomonas sp. Leaf24]
MRAAIVARYDGVACLGKGIARLLLLKGAFCRCGVILRLAGEGGRLVAQFSQERFWAAGS